MRFSDEDEIEGRVDVAARERERRERQLREAMASGLPELPRSRLAFGRFVIEDEATGDFFAPLRGEFFEAKYSAAIAFYIDEDGQPRFLERPPGPRNRAELEAKQAARLARKNAPRRRPAWMRR
jgi:hypothetical protein